MSTPVDDDDDDRPSESTPPPEQEAKDGDSDGNNVVDRMLRQIRDPGPFRRVVVSSPNLFRDVEFRSRLQRMWSVSGQPPSPRLEASGTMAEGLGGGGYRGERRLWRRGDVLWIAPPYNSVQAKWKDMPQVHHRSSNHNRALQFF